MVVVDMRGRRIDASLAGKAAGAVGLREGEMKPVSENLCPATKLWLCCQPG